MAIAAHLVHVDADAWTRVLLGSRTLECLSVLFVCYLYFLHPALLCMYASKNVLHWVQVVQQQQQAAAIAGWLPIKELGHTGLISWAQCATVLSTGWCQTHSLHLRQTPQAYVSCQLRATKYHSHCSTPSLQSVLRQTGNCLSRLALLCSHR